VRVTVTDTMEHADIMVSNASVLDSVKLCALQILLFSDSLHRASSLLVAVSTTEKETKVVD